MARIILHNAKVYIEKGQYAEAVMTDGGRIAKVGTNEEVLALKADGDEIIDCGGKTLIPGFNDTHVHLFSVAEEEKVLSLYGVKSVDEIVERCEAFLKEHPVAEGEGFYATNWLQDDLKGEKLTRCGLDRISTEFPIVLAEYGGHVRVANSKAMEMLGITAETPQLDGGEFVIGDDGEPTGVFVGLATNMLNDIIPKFTFDVYKEVLNITDHHCLEFGITTVHGNDIGYSVADHDAGFELLKEMEEEGTLNIRFRSQTSFKSAEQCEEFLKNSPHVANDYEEDPKITFGGMKLLRDGAPIGKTAMFTDGYPGDPDNKGTEWHSLPYMKEIIKLGKKYDAPVTVHTMGDLAVTQTLDLFDEIYTEGNVNRNMILHCEFMDAETIERVIRDDIYMSVEPLGLDMTMGFIDEVVGEKLKSTSHSFNTFLSRGAHLSFSTDAPAISLNPFPNIYTAVTRKGRWYTPGAVHRPEEAIDREAAIDAYTIEGAYLEKLEHCKGRIKEGYYADMALLSDDIFTCDEEEIPDIVSDLTIIKGEVVYRR